MARTSPITIGLGVLMVGVLATGVWLVTRPRHVGEHLTAEETPEPVAAPGRAPPPAPAPVAALAPRSPAPVPSAPLPVPAPVAEGAPDEPSAATVPAIPGRRALLVKSHNMRLVEADEEAFRSLNLDEATRARVRAINETHRILTEHDANASAARATVRERLEALRLLLGNEGAQKFDAAERTALRNVRGKNAFEWGQLGRRPDGTSGQPPAGQQN
jgi:hypothetical protein